MTQTNLRRPDPEERRTCTTCGSRDVTYHHTQRCRIQTEARTEAKALGATQGIPEVATDDLWAHLGHVAMPQDATRIVRQVIDLGWRPVVGSEPNRKWTPPATDRADA